MMNAYGLTLTLVFDLTFRWGDWTWPFFPEGGSVPFLLMAFGFAGCGRDGAAGVVGGNFPVLLIGWRLGRRGDSGSRSR